MTQRRGALKLGGTLPADVLAEIQGCLDKVAASGVTAMGRLDQTQKLPACLPLATAQVLVNSTVALAGQFSDDNYCSSPGGAFLD